MVDGYGRRCPPLQPCAPRLGSAPCGLSARAWQWTPPRSRRRQQSPPAEAVCARRGVASPGEPHEEQLPPRQQTALPHDWMSASERAFEEGVRGRFDRHLPSAKSEGRTGSTTLGSGPLSNPDTVKAPRCRPITAKGAIRLRTGNTGGDWPDFFNAGLTATEEEHNRPPAYPTVQP